MKNILDLDISEMTGISFDCTCGKHHSIDIRDIIIDNDIYPGLLETVKDYKRGRLFLVADSNTYGISGRRMEEVLSEGGFTVDRYVFDSPERLVPDEKAVGRLLIEIPADTSLIISVGSGTLNDLGRILSYKTGIPYIIIGTAPSMDGYASTVSPLIVGGFKMTYEAVYPRAILAELQTVKAAPKEMICAGFGDIIGKYTALTDWELSVELNNEYYCSTVAQLMRNSVKKCMENADGIARREDNAVRYLLETLILSGLAMGLAGNSRPASGAEHHLAHYWEMDALAKGEDHPLHGNCVGVGCVIISHVYRLVKEKTNLKTEFPDPDTIKSLLNRAGCIDNPRDLGIGRKLFIESVLHAKEVRPRYTVLHLAEKLGILEEAANKLAAIFYGE